MRTRGFFPFSFLDLSFFTKSVTTSNFHKTQVLFSKIKNKGLYEGTSKRFYSFELIIVMLVVVILSIFIGVRWPSSALFSQSSVAEQIRRDIRYTQILAMSLNTNYSIAFTSNNYTITPNPPSGAYTITMPSRVTLSASTSPIMFNSLGNPSTAATITVAASGSLITLTIAAETGFVNG